jgi:sec-independent protein translocase protein TatB
MLSLSPAKLLVVLVVALIVLGPEKLPQLARQLGAAWGDLRRFRHRLESDVRGAFPDLPPAHEVAQAVRSPLAFLDRLADEHERTKAAEEAGGSDDGDASAGPSPPPAVAANGNGTGGHQVETAVGEWGPGSGPDLGSARLVADDPTMN